jgi:hypothetical protein
VDTIPGGGATFNSKVEDHFEGRSEFVGQIAPDTIRDKYVFRSIDHYFKQGNQNPIMYFNLK